LEYGGNRLNVIIQHYKFNTFIAIFLISNRLYLILLSNSRSIRIYQTKLTYIFPKW